MHLKCYRLVCEECSFPDDDDDTDYNFMLNQLINYNNTFTNYNNK